MEVKVETSEIKERGEEQSKVAKKRVMVAIDESDCSYYALIWALDNFKDSIAESPLVIFATQKSPNYFYTCAASFGSPHLFHPFAIPGNHILGFLDISCNFFCSQAIRQSQAMDLLKSVTAVEKRVAVGLLEKSKNICASRGVLVELVTEDGDPKVAICEAVNKLYIDLLIVGSGHGTKNSSDKSVSSYCAMNAKCPVVVVKKP